MNGASGLHSGGDEVAYQHSMQFLASVQVQVQVQVQMGEDPARSANQYSCGSTPLPSEEERPDLGALQMLSLWPA